LQQRALATPILPANPQDSDRLDAYAAAYLEGRPEANPKIARRLAAKPLFHAGLMVKTGDADAMVAGAASATARVIEAE
jgi:phosphate acetyltransferase